MHCPKCGQQQSNEEIRFCSRCGFLLTGIAKVIENNGIVPAVDSKPQQSKRPTPRRRGVMKGLFFILLAFLFVPLVTMISIAAQAGPFAALFTLFVFGVGGLLRVAYAVMFEAGEADYLPEHSERYEELQSAEARSLSGGTAIPVQSYSPPKTGMWRDTNELQKEPGSVTDSTTRLLERETGDQ